MWIALLSVKAKPEKGDVLKNHTSQIEILNLSNREVFSQFFQETNVQVYRYLYGLTGGPTDAVEDLTADSYARAWSACASFRGDSTAALHWMMKIAKHQVIDAFRRRKSSGEHEPLQNYDPPAHTTSLEEQVLSSERSVILWKLLQTLPDEPREMLVLRYMLDWAIGEIARYMHKNETAVSMAVHRALKQLQQRWPVNEIMFEPGSVLND